MTTTGSHRILTLDTIRGVAVMGILLMNIVGFGLIEAAYMNPRAQGGASGIDLAVYLFNFVMFDGKMRGLFSFLFGASTLLVIDHATAKGESAAKVHYSRMVWLLIFGIAHLFLVWWGDILNHYALVGMIAFFFRNLRVKALVIIGCVLIAIETLIIGLLPMIVHAMQAGLIPNTTPAQNARGLEDFAKSFGVPSAAWIARQVAVHQGSYDALVANRIDKHGGSILSNLPVIGWETLGYMLFGMAGLKSGMLAGAWPRGRYVKWLTICFGIGIPCYIAIAAMMASHGFDLFSVMLGVMALATPVRPLMILGWACLIVLLMRPGGMLTTRIAAAGRMAFTNYLVTSLICTTIFYGYGFGLYGQLHRAELYLVVAAVWAGMLLWSKPWLENFSYGPFEWLWRSLASGSLQTIRGGVLSRA